MKLCAMQGIHSVPAEFVEAQVKSVLMDIGADVVSSTSAAYRLFA